MDKWHHCVFYCCVNKNKNCIQTRTNIIHFSILMFFCLFVFSVFMSKSRAKECDRATTQVTILLPTSGATWWHRRKISTMSGRTRDATACPLARSIAESIRTPTRTTRIPIRMHTSRTATEVHLAATATTPDIGSEPSSIEQPEPRRPRFYPHSMLQQSQDIPWLYIFLGWHVGLLPNWFPL